MSFLLTVCAVNSSKRYLLSCLAQQVHLISHISVFCNAISSIVRIRRRRRRRREETQKIPQGIKKMFFLEQLADINLCVRLSCLCEFFLKLFQELFSDFFRPTTNSESIDGNYVMRHVACAKQLN